MPKCQNSNETFLVIFKQCELASIWQVFPNSFLEQQVLSLSVSSEKVNSSHDIFTHDFVFMQFFFKASILFSQMIFFLFASHTNVCYNLTRTRCLKITEKVSFNIASEASYVYILSGQKFIKNA